MSGTTLLAVATIAIPAAVAVFVAIRQGKSSDKTGMAAQFTALAERLSAAETRLEEMRVKLEKTEEKLDNAQNRGDTEHQEAEKWRQVSVALWGVIVKNDHLEVPPWVETQLREAGMIL